MLVTIQDVPTTIEDWDRWALAHRDSHQKIIQAIRKLGTSLAEYVLEPINFDDFDEWKRRNQENHNDMNGFLEAQGTDLTGLDPTDAENLTEWIDQHYQEHLTAESKLGI